MNTQDPLAALHPLRAPEAISWWPPAPGWWALFAAILLLVALAAYWVFRRHRRNAYRREALLRLARLQREYQSTGDASHYLGEVNALLKTVALVSYPAREIASAHGSAWREFLNRNLPQAMHLQAAFDDAAYRRHCPAIDVDSVHRAARYWIKQHRCAR